MSTTSRPLLNRPAQKNCWKCGASFICGPQGKEEKCWCNALPAISPSDGADCFCPACLRVEISGQQSNPGNRAVGVPAATDDASVRPPLMEGEDYYKEGPAIVFTTAYLLRRGYCCGNGCRHCPYEGAVVKKTPGRYPLA